MVIHYSKRLTISLKIQIQIIYTLKHKKNDGRIHQTPKSFTLESGVVRFLLNRVLRGPNWNAVVL